MKHEEITAFKRVTEKIAEWETEHMLNTEESDICKKGQFALFFSLCFLFMLYYVM